MLRVESFEPFEIPHDSWHQYWNFDIERLQIFAHVLVINLNHHRRAHWSARPHTTRSQRYSFFLNFLDEFHECGSSDDAHFFLDITPPIHSS